MNVLSSITEFEAADHDLKEVDCAMHAEMPISAEDKRLQYYRKGISCPYCYKLTSEERKKEIKERPNKLN